MTNRKIVMPDSGFLSDSGDGRLSAPSAERNFPAILECMAQYIVQDARVLEIASGTGQQIAALASAFPSVTWQPSEIDEGRIASIRAWRDGYDGDNLCAPIHLDAALAWPGDLTGYDLVFTVNLFHLISQDEAEAVFAGMAGALKSGGRAFVYGPFIDGGDYRSDGDAAFDRSLRAQDAQIGYKDRIWMRDGLARAGLHLAEAHEMPANNLVLVAERAHR